MRDFITTDVKSIVQRHRLMWVLLLLLLAPLIAQSPADNLAVLKSQLEDLKKEYWAFKSDSLRERKELEDNLNLLDLEVKSSYLKKNNLQEEFFLIKENQSKLEEKAEEKQAEISTLHSRLKELVEVEKKKSRGLFPYLLDTSIGKLGEVDRLIENNNHRGALTQLIAYRTYLLAEAQSSAINNKTLLRPGLEQSVAGQGIRLGFVHESFTSEQGEALLLRRTDLSGVRYEWLFDLPGDKKDDIRRGIQSAFSGNRDVIYVPLDAGQAGGKLKSIAGAERGGLLKWFIRLFESGGVLMYPLAAVAIFALVITVERSIFFRRNSRGVKTVVFQLTESINEGKKKQALDICRGNNNPVTRVVAPLLEHRIKNKTTGRELLEETMIAEMPHLEKRLSTLSVLAAIAPLIGLLGTVVGMIALFDVITLYGTNNPKILAGGISIALVTTQSGLAIAIPIILIHHLLTRVKTRLVNSVERSAVLVLNRLFP